MSNDKMDLLQRRDLIKKIEVTQTVLSELLVMAEKYLAEEASTAKEYWRGYKKAIEAAINLIGTGD